MSFSRKVKEELKDRLPKARHCKMAELAAIFMMGGAIRQDKKQHIHVEFHTENLTVAQKSYILLRDVFYMDVQIRVRNHNVRGSTREYFLDILDQKAVVSFLKAMKYLSEGESLSDLDCEGKGYYPGVGRIIQQPCCKRAFLRGAFLTVGSLTDPTKSYHLEFAVLSGEIARQLQQLMQFFELDAKIIRRKKYQVVYIKDGEQIADFLKLVEAHQALMDYENIRIVKEVRNSVNRRVNCETANIDKTVTAAAKQVADIQYIDCHMGLQKLTKGLREIAELRLEHPDVSLQELGKLLTPSIGKSGVNHRLRKLGEIADGLREKAVDFSPKKEDM